MRAVGAILLVFIIMAFLRPEGIPAFRKSLLLNYDNSAGADLLHLVADERSRELALRERDRLTIRVRYPVTGSELLQIHGFDGREFPNVTAAVDHAVHGDLEGAQLQPGDTLTASLNFTDVP